MKPELSVELVITILLLIFLICLPFYQAGAADPLDYVGSQTCGEYHADQEAAKAAEAGRGFAVVAQEIKELAK